MRVFGVMASALVVMTLTVGGQQVPQDQWPNYQHNSNFSPLTQITPANVATPDQGVDIQLRSGLAAGRRPVARLPL